MEASTTPSTVFVVDEMRGSLVRLLKSRGFHVTQFECVDALLDNKTDGHLGCLLLEAEMPAGLKYLQQLIDHAFPLPTVVVTSGATVSQCALAFRLGAFDFLERPFECELLFDRIQSAIDRATELYSVNSKRKEIALRVRLLTPREREIMDDLVSGKSIKQIAGELGVSIQTISRHRHSILEKMEVKNDVELVNVCLLADGNSC